MWVSVCVCVESMCMYLVSVRGVLVHVDYGPTYTTFFQVLACNWICIVCSHTLRHTHTHTCSPRHCGTHFDPDLITCTHPPSCLCLAWFSFVPSYCPHFLMHFLGPNSFLFQSPEWRSWLPVITPYILIFICQHSEGSSNKNIYSKKPALVPKALYPCGLFKLQYFKNNFVYECVKVIMNMYLLYLILPVCC